MRIRTSAAAAAIVLGLVLFLGLPACGDAPAPTPAPAPGPGPDTGPPVPVPEVWDAPRLFASVGPRTLRLTFGTSEADARLLLNRTAAGDTEAERSAGLQAVAESLAAVVAVDDDAASRPALLVWAEPGTPWRPIAELLAIAGDPSLGITDFDLRLPWDEAPKDIRLVPADVDGQPLTIAFSHVPAVDGKAERWNVLVGTRTTFSFHAAFDPSLRKLDEPAMQGLRSALQGFARSWPDEPRRVALAIPMDPAPSYINVLTILRICREKQFDQFTLAQP